MTKSLTGIVNAEDVVQNSEYLHTLMVVIPRYVLPNLPFSLSFHSFSPFYSPLQNPVQGVVELLRAADCYGGSTLI